MNYVCIYFAIATPFKTVWIQKKPNQWKKYARAHKIYVFLLQCAPSHPLRIHPTYSRSLITNKSELQNIHTHIHTHTQDTKEKEAPIEQPRRLSLRRPSFKQVELIQNESFIDIQLKPVTKDKVSPQKAQQSESQLTKVTTALHRSQQTKACRLLLTHSLSLSVCLFRSFSLLVSLFIKNRWLFFFFLSIFICLFFFNFFYLSYSSIALHNSRYFNRS